MEITGEESTQRATAGLSTTDHFGAVIAFAEHFGYTTAFDSGRGYDGNGNRYVVFTDPDHAADYLSNGGILAKRITVVFDPGGAIETSYLMVDNLRVADVLRDVGANARLVCTAELFMENPAAPVERQGVRHL